MKVAQKFTLALVVVIVVTLAARAIFDARRSIRLHEHQIHRAQQQLGNVLEASVREIWRSVGWERALAFLERVEAQQGAVQIRWVWLDHGVRKEYTPAVPVDTILSHVSSSSIAVAFDRRELPGSIATYKPVQLPELPLGAIELIRTTRESEAHIREEMYRQIAVSLLVLFLYALVATILGRRMIGRPIDALISHAHRVGVGDFSTGSSAKSKDEIGRLTSAMNEMSEHLETARLRIQSERSARLEVQDQLRHADRMASVGRITASIVHDIGTPLNVISGRALMIAEGDVKPEAIPETAHKISEQAMRIATMIRELLGFARRGETTSQKTDIAALAKVDRLANSPSPRMRQ